MVIFKKRNPTGSQGSPGNTEVYDQKARGPTRTISGFVRSAKDGEKLIHARIYDLRSRRGAISNSYGFFSLQLPRDSVFLAVSYMGKESQRHDLLLTTNRTLNFMLEDYELETVDIIADEISRIEQETQMSQVDVPVDQIKKAPALMGEVDALKTLQLLPGVQSGSEGGTGLYVRGGGPDQNLILLDGVPLYYVSHLGGLFSIFNADALNHVSLTKGGFPARYGGRLSSVLDVHMKEGNMKELKAELMVGILTAKLAVQGPLKKDKTSYMFSIRRSYFDLFSRALTKAASQGNALFGVVYYDLNFKLNHIISEKDRIYFSSYFGEDRVFLNYENSIVEDSASFDQLADAQIAWGNKIAAIRWNRVWSPRLFSNFTTTFGKYSFLTEVGAEIRSSEAPEDNFDSRIRYDSGIQDVTAKLDFDYYLRPGHSLRFGANITHHLFIPGITTITGSIVERDTSIGDFETPATEVYAYVENRIRIGKKLGLNLGLHAANYFVQGEQYPSLQPRLSARYMLGKRVALKASYVRMAQFIHLLTNTDASLPIDLWVPATRNVKPQQSTQYALGLAGSLAGNRLEWSLETYHKRMQGLIEYKEGIEFIGNAENWEEKVESGGTGEAYGVEFLLQKKKGKTSGWIGYTLAWNNRQFDNINGGRTFPYRYDRRHDVSLTLAHAFTKKTSFSANWVFGTGNAVTLANGKHNSLFLDQLLAPRSGAPQVYTYSQERNGVRMRNYHRLDIAFDFSKEKKWGETNLEPRFLQYLQPSKSLLLFFSGGCQRSGRN